MAHIAIKQGRAYGDTKNNHHMNISGKSMRSPYNALATFRKLITIYKIFQSWSLSLATRFKQYY